MMRWRLALALVCLIGLALLTAFSAARVAAPADAPTATPALALPARIAQVEHGLIVEVRIRYEDGYEQSISAAGGSPTATPSPTTTAAAQPTAAPTNTLRPTATVTPTLTPIPTNTPRPTLTPTPSATPTPTLQPTFTVAPTLVPILTPTPQTTVQPPTPLPTLPPPDEVCYGTVKTDGLRFRDAPVTGTVIGSWSLNERVRILAVQYAGADEWAQIRGANDRIGWSASYYGGQVFITYDNSPECLTVRFPETAAAWTIHVVPNYNALELVSSYSTLGAAGIPFGVKSYADFGACIQALEAGGICVLRIPVGGQDCPQKIGSAEPVASALEWMRIYKGVLAQVWPYRHSGRLFIEVVNECYFGSSADVGVICWWASWLMTAVEYAIAEDFPPLVAPTFAPGDGDSVFQYSIWRPALQKLADAGGAIGWHDYTPYHNNGLCSCDEWLACRHRRNYAAIQAAGITGLEYMITEAARGWGGDPVDEADFICWYDQVKHDPGLSLVSAWLGGYHPMWPLANLDGHYISLAQQLAALP